MTRDEALETLEAFANFLDAGPTAKHHIKELREVIAALSSCACGDRKPIWTGCAQVHTVAGHKAYADAGSIILRGEDVKKGQSLEVLIFALPTEETAHGRAP